MALNRMQGDVQGTRGVGRSRSGTIAGKVISSDMQRLADSFGGPREVVNYTFEKYAVSDFIGWLMARSLWKVLIIFFLSFVVIIGFFGLLLFVDPSGISTPTNKEANSLDCCWLSLQTFTTIGYGGLSPKKKWAHFIVSADAFVGQLYVAVLTTVFLAHLMTPHPHWKVSDVICVHQDSKGRLVIEARFLIAPGKSYFDVECSMQADLNDTPSGQDVSSGTIAVDLNLEHDFALIRSGITSMVHIIDEHSPLVFLYKNQLSDLENISSLCVKVQCKDPRLQSMTTSAKQFASEDILLNESFKEMTVMDETKGHFVMDAELLSETKPSNKMHFETCVHCNNIFMPDSKFCRKCGKARPLKEQAVIESELDDEEGVDENDGDEEAPRWNLKWEPSAGAEDGASVAGGSRSSKKENRGSVKKKGQTWSLSRLQEPAHGI